MSNITYKTRIQHKIDTTANWALATNFIPLKGELIIYSDGDNATPKIKIGDGVTVVTELPFVTSENGGSSEIIAGLTIDLNDAEAGIAPFTNSDQLGGIPANEYALKTDVEEIAAASNNSVKLMSAEEFEALTTEQKTALYNEGVRVIAVDGELDPDNISDMQRFADFNNPVGTIREFNVPTNPATLFGIGTWESYMPGRVLIGAGTADYGTAYTAGQTGGEATHTLTIDEMPWHSHHYIDTGKFSTAAGAAMAPLWGDSMGDTSATTGGVGGSQPHNNMQPYAVVYRWLRVA